MATVGQSDDHSYLARVALARVEIDKQLAAGGWDFQSQDQLNLGGGVGVAAREFAESHRGNRTARWTISSS